MKHKEEKSLFLDIAMCVYIYKGRYFTANLDVDILIKKNLTIMYFSDFMLTFCRARLINVKRENLTA